MPSGPQSGFGCLPAQDISFFTKLSALKANPELDFPAGIRRA
jgi:hypothetical protein